MPPATDSSNPFSVPSRTLNDNHSPCPSPYTLHQTLDHFSLPPSKEEIYNCKDPGEMVVKGIGVWEKAAMGRVSLFR